MKKAIIILISVLLITSFAACRNGDTPETAGTTAPESTSNESTAEISSVPQTFEKTLDGVTLKVCIENPKVKIYCDDSMKRFETVFPACGSDNSAIELTCEELYQYSKAIGWIDVCKLPEVQA